MLKRLIITPLMLVLSLIASGSVLADTVNVTVAELEALISEGVQVIDVRRAEEWKHTGVIEGSELLTFFDRQGRHDAEAWLAAASKFAKPENPVALICHTGVRSTVVSRWLTAEQGYTKIYNVTDGILGWKNAGKSLQKPTTTE
ncbi:MAG: rhodanese-like domain-containing protein [Granulosicoccus sp.]